MLKSMIVLCIALLLLTSCATGKQVAKTSTPNRKVSSYLEPAYHPSYFRENSIHWKRGFSDGLGEVEVNGKWGYINSSGQIAIKPKFDEVLPFHEGIGMVRSGAIINRRKAALFRLTGRWKYIDKKGRAIFKIPSNYYVGEFSEGLAVVCVEGKSTGFLAREQKYGFIDKKGQIIIPAEYDDAFSFSEGLAMIRDRSGKYPKYGYINKAGEVVIEPQYRYAGDFSEGLANVNIDGKWGFINKRNEVVIPLQYSGVGRYHKGLALVRKNKKDGYIDKSGNLVIPLKFDEAFGFSEGLAAIIVDGKIGYINKAGESVIEPQFEYFPWWETPGYTSRAPFVSSFSEGLAAVMLGGKWGYINKKGDFVIKPQFDLAGSFTEGFAKVAVGDKLGYIDKQGKYIWEPTR